MIRCITLEQIICDDCHKTILLENWRDADKLGWCVPCDGAFQKCPDCTKRYKDRLSAEVKLAEIAKMIILTRGQAQRIDEFMDWAIETFKHQADEIIPGNYSPKLQDAIELQKNIKRELEVSR